MMSSERETQMTNSLIETVGKVDFIAELNQETKCVRIIQLNHAPAEGSTMVEEILEVSPKKLMEILLEYVKYGSAKDLSDKLAEQTEQISKAGWEKEYIRSMHPGENPFA